MMGLKTLVLACLAGRTLRKGLLWLGVLAVAWVLLLWQAVPRLAQWYLPKLVQERSGHTLHIGRLQLQPFTWALTVDDVLLSTPSQAPLLVLPHAMVDIAAMPLFLGRVQLDTVAVDGLQAHLGLAANGRLNWMDLIAAFKTPEPDPPKPPPAVFLRQVEVRQAVLHWRDERTQPAFVSRLEPFDLSLANVSTRADGQGKLNLQARTSLDAKLSVQTQFALNPLNAQGQVQLDGLNLAKLEALLRPILPIPAPQGRFSARAEFAIAAPATGEQTPSVQVSKLDAELKNAVLVPTLAAGAPRLVVDSLALRQGQWRWPAGTLAAESLQLQGLQATLAGGAPGVGVAGVQLGPLAVQPAQAQAQLGQLAVQGIAAQLQRQASGQWAWQATVDQWAQALAGQSKPEKAENAEKPNNNAAPPGATHVETNSASKAQAQPWRYQLDGLSVENIALDYQDDALAPGFATGVRGGQLSVGGFEHQVGQPLQKLPISLAASLTTGGTLAVQGMVQPQPLQVDATVDVQKLGLPVASPFLRPYVRLALDQGEFNTRGRLQHSSGGDGSGGGAGTSRYQGEASVENLRLVELTEDGNPKPGSTQPSSAKSSSAKSSSAKSSSAKPASPPKLSPFLSFKRLRALNLELSPSSARIPRLELQGLDTALLIAADKSTNIGRILVSSTGKSARSSVKSAQPEKSSEPEKSAKPEELAKPASTVKPEKPAPSAAPPAFAWRIDRFVLQNSEMDFADRSLVLPFGTRIHDLSGMVTGLSNRPGQRGELTLKGAVDDYGLAQATGRLDLFDPTAFTDIKVNFRNVEMTNLTPYSATFANRRINSGKLSLELAYQIQNQALNSSNRVLIDRLVLGERVQSPNAVDLPLDLAVAILQDANGRIDLGIPIRGTLNDPQFSYGDVVMKALINVLTKVVTAPFRALAGLLGGESAPEAVAYAPGQTVLDPPQREQLKRLVQMLETRPKMQLVVHGTWAKADQDALQARLLQQAVAAYNGDKLQAGEDPGPLALESPAVQKALEALYSKRFGAGALGALKEGFRQGNPGQLPSNAVAQAAAQLGQWLRDAKPLGADEVRALQGKAWPQVLAERLQAAQDVGPAQLQALASARQEALVAAMLAQAEGGKLAGRVQAGSPRQAEPDAQQQVPVAMEVLALP